MEVGYLKGEICGRNGCQGMIEEHPSESCCSCHINPPCSYCTDAREFCSICGWEGREEQLEKQYKPVNNDAQSVYNRCMASYDVYRKKIDDVRSGLVKAEKVEWYDLGHTHFTMKKVGVFPVGMSIEELKKELAGTFGGRFEGLDLQKGTFTYIAYTD